MLLSKEEKDSLSLKLNKLFTKNPKNTETDALSQFLDELKLCMAKDPDFIIQLLQQQAKGLWTVGHLIARYQTNPEGVQAYVALLNSLVSAKQVIDLLQLQNQDGWTVGHLIARYQTSPEGVHAYVALLNSLAASQSKKVMGLLRLQTNDGWTVGRFIADFQKNPEVVQAYIALLNSLAASQPPEVMGLLRLQTNDGGTVGRFIAGYLANPAVAQAYVGLLNSLGESQPNDVITLLTQKTGDGWTVGHAIAYYQKELIIAYLNVLQNLVSSQPEQVFMLLMSRLSDSKDAILQAKITEMGGLALGEMLTEKNQIQTYNKLLYTTFIAIFNSQEVILLLGQLRRRGTVLDVIADYLTNPAVAQAYVAALNSLEKSQCQKVIFLLQHQSAYGWTAGHMIARYQKNPEVVQAYIALLNSLAESQPLNVIDVLQRYDASRWTVGHVIARCQKSPEVVQAYVALLNNLAESKPLNVISLLQKQTENHWTVGHLIGRYQEELIIVYLNVLQNLVSVQPAQVFKLLMGRTLLSYVEDSEPKEKITKMEGVALREMLTKEDHIQAYNKLLCDTFVAIFGSSVTSRQINAYLPYKNQLKEALLSMSPHGPDTLDLLKRCVNRNDSLGRYCHTYRSETSLFFVFETKMVRDISARIQEIEEIKKIAQPPVSSSTNIHPSINTIESTGTVGIEMNFLIRFSLPS